MKVFQLLLLLLLCFILSCQQNSKQKQMQEKVSEWQGITLSIPQHYSINWNENDSCDLYSGYEYKIVYYIDGDCYACLELLPQIDSVYQTIKSQNSVLLIYFHSADYEHLEKIMTNQMKKLHIPLIYDKTNSFYHQNKLFLDPLFHCFLVDKDNKVVVAGSFIANQKMTTLYSKILQNQNNSLTN